MLNAGSCASVVPLPRPTPALPEGTEFAEGTNLVDSISATCAAPKTPTAIAFGILGKASETAKNVLIRAVEIAKAFCNLKFHKAISSLFFCSFSSFSAI